MISATCTMYVLLYGTEIQELDSSMQYLVYENHSKFIKASETIREVSVPLNVCTSECVYL